GIGGVLFRVDLEVVALDEERTTPTLLKGSSRHYRDILSGSLIRVSDFRSGDLADQGADVQLFRGGEQGTAGIEGGCADVHGRDGESADLAAAARDVEVVYRSGDDAECRGGL